MSFKILSIYTDGACSGNPGPAGIGVVIKNGEEKVKEISRPIGIATNNIAEYTALIVALEEALALKAQAVDVTTDSELMCKQITGVYAVKHENIIPLFEQVKQLAKQFSAFHIKHVKREFNKEADKLSTQAIKKISQDGRPAIADGGEESPSSKG